MRWMSPRLTLCVDDDLATVVDDLATVVADLATVVAD
jgi:hypothetical protein